MNLRMHHLLCSVLFQGKGYSNEFVENMAKIVNALKCEDTLVHLSCSPDAICQGCPNAMSDGRCALDLEAETKQSTTTKQEISTLDQRIGAHFHLEYGKTYTSKELFTLLDKTLDEPFFEECCQSCRWYRQGLCSYSLYRKRLSAYFLH